MDLNNMPNQASKLTDEMHVRQSLQGDRNSLEQLIKRYNDLVYNLSIKMTQNTADAADCTQEIFIRVITKLSTFREESLFSTWLYRIAVNQLLNYRKSPAVKARNSFRQFGEALDGARDEEFTAGERYEADKELLFEETKQTCMSGMLLCLDKKHRLVFLLGEVFGINDKTGSQLLDVTPENFRMMLSRARRDLYNFMQEKCGLINTANPCRCAKKTKAFIAAGYVNPQSLRFSGKHIRTIEGAAEQKQQELDDLLANEYRKLFLSHTFLQGPDIVGSFRQLLQSEKLNRIFNL
jgi:RNA polymerase sigma factor (sigma-70 family)